jgi:parvulin-like peptidyl-prolyl isomerase
VNRVVGTIGLTLACAWAGFAATSEDGAAPDRAARGSSDRVDPAAPAADEPLAAPAGEPADGDVVARIGTRKITKDQLLAPMLEEHGLAFLLHLVQLDLARQAAAQHGVTVTADDVQAERDRTFKQMLAETRAKLQEQFDAAVAKEDNAAAERIKAQMQIDPEAALDAYLAQRFTVTREYVSKGEFNIVLETNAHLRKIAEASPDLKKLVTDEAVRKAFDAQFGVKVVIRHLQANNLATVTEARRRIEAGESFAAVAQALSTNANTAPNGGAVRPFTMIDADIPQLFRDVAFGLGQDEVSDTFQSNNAFHIIKLERRIAPKVVEFENVKDQVRAGLMEQVLDAGVKQLRDKLAKQARANVRIEHPVLKRQYERRLEERRLQNQQQLDEQLKRDRAADPAGVGDQPAGAEPPAEPAPADGAAVPEGAAGDDPQPRTGTAPKTPARPAPAAPPAAKPKATKPAQAPAPAAPADDNESPPADDDR